MARKTDMNKENVALANIQQPTTRVTRTRDKSMSISGGLLPLHPQMKKESNHVLQPNSKGGSSDSKSTDVGSRIQSKRRAVFTDVTNKPFNDLNMKVISEIKIQTSKETGSVVCVGPQVRKGK